MMSHPDPKTHLLQRGWTVDDDITPTWVPPNKIGFDVTLNDGKLMLYLTATSIDIDASDMCALSLLAEQTRKPIDPREQLIVALMDINDIERDLAEKHVDSYIERKVKHG
jgi:hypothetical protein